MKFSIAILSSLLGSASSFGIVGQGGVVRTRATFLQATPAHFDRAVECATHFGECDLNEIASLADGKLSSVG